MKWGVTFAVAGLLLLLGLAGRRQSWLRLDLDTVISAADPLQSAMDESQRLFEPRASGSPVLNTNGSPGWVARPQVAEQASLLKSSLSKFDQAYARTRLAPAEDLERRLGVATLANAEGRFAAALAAITAEDLQPSEAISRMDRNRRIRVHQVLADAHYGQREWQLALENYRKIVEIKPDLLAALGRIGECQVALGKLVEALATYDQLADRHVATGHSLLTQLRPEAASHYGKALDIRRRVATQSQQSEAVSKLAVGYNHWSVAQLLQHKPEAAIAPLEQAIEVQKRLIEEFGMTLETTRLATSHAHLAKACFLAGKLENAEAELLKAIHRLQPVAASPTNEPASAQLASLLLGQGHAQLGQQKLDAAAESYGRAIETFSRLKDPALKVASLQDLAISYNSRGVVQRALGSLEAAQEDFEQALRLLQPLAESTLTRPNDQPRIAPRRLSQDPEFEPDLRLEVALSFTGKSIDVLSRARLAQGLGGRPEIGVAYATVLKNRGCYRLVKDLVTPAIDDLTQGASVYRQLVDEEGQKDLSPQFAKSLLPLAWIFAAHSEPAVRNGRRAKALALHACELSDWKSSPPLEALAAASAELQDFPEAKKWQERAIEFAPAQQKDDLRSRLRLYLAGQAYRMSTNAPPPF